MFTGINLCKFNREFATENDCLRYLFEAKWSKGFKCSKCKHVGYGKGRTPYHLRCSRCGYDESPTARTLFQNLKFPLLKAFGIIFKMVVTSNGESSLSVAEQFDLNPKTSWRFMKKVQMAMAEEVSKQKVPKARSEYKRIDAINVSFRGKDLNGFQQVNFFFKRKDDRTLIMVPSTRKVLFSNHEGKDDSDLLWGHYVQPNKDIKMWNLKAWITGTHHHCSGKYLEGYLAEFIFRYNHRKNKEMIFHKLIKSFLGFESGSGGWFGSKRVNRIAVSD